MTEAPVSTMPSDQGQFVLDTDASAESIGAVLSRYLDGYERVLCYGSTVCSVAEQNYDITRREILAVVYFIKTFRQYLLGKKFLLRTDHSALQWFRRAPTPIGQEARWLSVVEEFDFEIQHRPGTSHANATALSRRPHRDSRVSGHQYNSAARLGSSDDYSGTTRRPGFSMGGRKEAVF